MENNFFRQPHLLFITILLIAGLAAGVAVACGFYGPPGIHYNTSSTMQNRRDAEPSLNFLGIKKTDLKPVFDRQSRETQDSRSFIDGIDQIITAGNLQQATARLADLRMDLIHRSLFRPADTDVREKLQQVNYRRLLLQGSPTINDTFTKILRAGRQLTTIQTVPVESQDVQPALKDDVIYLKNLSRLHRGKTNNFLTFPAQSPRKVEWQYLQTRNSEANHPDKAISRYQKLASRAPDHYLADDILVRRANLLLTNGQPTNALDEFWRILRKYPRTDHYHSILGTVAQALQNDTDLLSSRQGQIMRRIVNKLPAPEIEIPGPELATYSETSSFQQFLQENQPIPPSLKGLLFYLEQPENPEFLKQAVKYEFFPFIDDALQELGRKARNYSLRLVQKFPSSPYAMRFVELPIYWRVEEHFSEPIWQMLRVLRPIRKCEDYRIYLMLLRKKIDRESEDFKSTWLKALEDFGLINTYFRTGPTDHPPTSHSAKLLFNYPQTISTDQFLNNFIHLMDHFEQGFTRMRNADYWIKEPAAKADTDELHPKFPLYQGHKSTNHERYSTRAKRLLKLLDQWAKKDHPYEKILAGYIHLILENPDKTLQKIEKLNIDKLDKKQKSHARLLKARSYFLLGNHDQAITWYEQSIPAIQHHKLKKKSREHLALLYESQEQYGQAIRLYHQLDWEADRALTMDILAPKSALNKLRTEELPSRLQELVEYSLAVRNLRDKNPGKAERLFQHLGKEKQKQAQEMHAFRKRIDRAESREEKAFASYDRASFIYHKDLLFYNRPLWQGTRIPYLLYLKLLPREQDAKAVFNHIKNHNVKARAYRLFGKLYDKYPDINTIAERSLFSRALTTLYLMRYNSFWRRHSSHEYYVRRARQSFHQLHQQYPASNLADDALFWEAFYSEDKPKAFKRYQQLKKQYPEGDLTERYLKKSSEDTAPIWSNYSWRDDWLKE